jgi:hypothetical protein
MPHMGPARQARSDRQQGGMVAAETGIVQTAGRRVLDDLLQEHGLQPGAYALIFVVGEGTFFELPGMGDGDRSRI